MDLVSSQKALNRFEIHRPKAWHMRILRSMPARALIMPHPFQWPLFRSGGLSIVPLPEMIAWAVRISGSYNKSNLQCPQSLHLLLEEGGSQEKQGASHHRSLRKLDFKHFFTSYHLII